MAEGMNVKEMLSFSILQTERIATAVQEAKSYKVDCLELGKEADSVSKLLCSADRFVAANPSIYDRPVRCIVADVSNNLERACTLVRKCKCKRSAILSRVVTNTRKSDFRIVSDLLNTSHADMKWLLSIFDSDVSGVGIVLSLPPMAIKNPILSWVWSLVAAIQVAPLPFCVEAANQLASLALDNERNKKIIVEEGGVPPLLNLLKQGASSDAQIAAATALHDLANDQERVRIIGAEVIVHVLSHSSTRRVQIEVANLISRMAEHGLVVQEAFAEENTIIPLVKLLLSETFVDNLKGSSPGGHYKERENEDPEVKLKLKISCAEALRMLSKGCVSNCRRITETKGLLCLAKLIEKERGDLKLICLMTIMEITATAETHADLKRAAFKTTSTAVKTVVEQLLKVIQEESSPQLQIPAIKAMGYLARIFTAKETRVIAPLVTQLDNSNPDVATEAVIALGKFACLENFVCMEHSKTIIEFNGIPSLMGLVKANEQAQQHGLSLLCYLALNVSNSEALGQAGVLATLVEAIPSVAAQNSSLKELLCNAVRRLEVYQAGNSPPQTALSCRT